MEKFFSNEPQTQSETAHLEVLDAKSTLGRLLEPIANR